MYNKVLLPVKAAAADVYAKAATITNMVEARSLLVEKRSIR
ncbi:hypothetical protein [Lysinibacillus xylanilyticus]|nr:hypothetical protein [Lysinibacillus xylanilyticus]